VASTKIPFSVTHWNVLTILEKKGTTGTAFIKSLDLGDIKLRQIEYSLNYEADHFCQKGHIVYCISGSFEIELDDHNIHSITAGNTFHVSDNASSDKLLSKDGAKVFVADGNFLK
jgi:hypothetical protein